MIKKWNQYNEKKSKGKKNKDKKPKEHDNSNLSTGILEIDDEGEVKPIKEPVEIEQVIDIIKDESLISKIEENITVDTTVSVGEVKRGQIIYLTALLKRPHQTTPFNQTTMGVLKCRVVDYFYGLNKLKQVMRNK